MLIQSVIIIVFSLLFVASYALVQDFCVADLSLPETPSGFPCKDPRTLDEVSDMVYRGLSVPGNTSNSIKAAVTPAFTAQFPAVNGLGISMARLDLESGGYVPYHLHPRGSEILVVTEGTVFAFFVSLSTFASYGSFLSKGDIIVFPQGLPHIVINFGKVPAVAFSSFTSSGPGLMTIDIFNTASEIPTENMDAATAFLDAEIKKLKGIFGASGSGFDYGPY